MGEIADDHIDRLMDAGYFYGRTPSGYSHRQPQHKNKPKKKVDPKQQLLIAQEYPGKNTPAHLLQDYPEKTFDMSFFPTLKPKKEEPSDPWNLDGEAPF